MPGDWIVKENIPEGANVLSSNPDNTITLVDLPKEGVQDLYIYLKVGSHSFRFNENSYSNEEFAKKDLEWLTNKLKKKEYTLEDLSGGDVDFDLKWTLDESIKEGCERATNFTGYTNEQIAEMREDPTPCPHCGGPMPHQKPIYSAKGKYIQ